jgi:hypothetical protein
LMNFLSVRRENATASPALTVQLHLIGRAYSCSFIISFRTACEQMTESKRTAGGMASV